MQSVKVFVSKRLDTLDGWAKVVEALTAQDLPTYSQTTDADVSIVLGGMTINPMALRGKKILLFSKQTWDNQFDSLYGPVIKEYYDEMHDMTKHGLSSCVNYIKNLINEEADKPRS